MPPPEPIRLWGSPRRGRSGPLRTRSSTDLRCFLAGPDRARPQGHGDRPHDLLLCGAAPTSDPSAGDEAAPGSPTGRLFRMLENEPTNPSDSSNPDAPAGGSATTARKRTSTKKAAAPRAAATRTRAAKAVAGSAADTQRPPRRTPPRRRTPRGQENGRRPSDNTRRVTSSRPEPATAAKKAAKRAPRKAVKATGGSDQADQRRPRPTPNRPAAIPPCFSSPRAPIRGARKRPLGTRVRRWRGGGGGGTGEGSGAPRRRRRGGRGRRGGQGGQGSSPARRRLDRSDAADPRGADDGRT